MYIVYTYVHVCDRYCTLLLQCSPQYLAVTNVYYPVLVVPVHDMKQMIREAMVHDMKQMISEAVAEALRQVEDKKVPPPPNTPSPLSPPLHHLSETSTPTSFQVQSPYLSSPAHPIYYPMSPSPCLSSPPFSPDYSSAPYTSPPCNLPGPSNFGGQARSWATPPPAPRLCPPPAPRLCPPPSPTRQTLQPTSFIMEQCSGWLQGGSVGRLAIRLAKDCVFGADVMATGKLSDEGMVFIKNTIR